MSRLLVTLARLSLRAYQLALSPLIGPACRFSPSCSEYARQAFLAHGPARGAWLSIKRLSHCHPWHPGGCDPVPPSVGRAAQRGSNLGEGSRL